MGKNFIFYFEGSPKGWDALLHKVDGELTQESRLTWPTCTCDKCELTTSETFKQLIVKLEALWGDTDDFVLVHYSVQNLFFKIAQRDQVNIIKILSFFPYYLTQIKAHF